MFNLSPVLEKRVEKDKKKRELITEVMEEMANREFTVGEAEKFPELLKEALQRNSERFEKEKPFAIFEY